MQALNLAKPSVHPHDYTLTSTWLADNLERLNLLLPGVALCAKSDLQTCALAYIERYGDDLLQLEHEHEFLYMALLRAWGAGQFDACTRLASAMAHVVGRLPDPPRAEQIVRLGIEASRLCGDQTRFLSLINRLGGLLFSQGKYRHGSRLWQRSLQLAGSSGASLTLWEPFSSFAHIADIVGSYSMACLFADTIRKADKGRNSDSLIVAIFVRGFFARAANDPEAACDDISCALQLLAHVEPDSRSFAYRQLFTLAAQTELARAHKDYSRAQQYANSACSLASLFADHHTAADLLVDRVVFSSECGRLADSRSAFSLLQDMARRSGDPILSQRCRHLERRLAKYLEPRNGNTPGVSRSPAPWLPHEALTSREIEVLSFVAQGLSNEEIARRLVVTPATVKKHLEHVYDKIGAHSRTAAVARARALQILP